MFRAIGVVTLAVSGCAAADEPRLLAIEPARVSTAHATPAVVTGSNLRAALHLDLDSHDPATVDAGWTVLIADAAMPDTHWRDRTSLDVTLPSGLPIGTHDVHAVAPDGTALVLEGALVVVTEDELGPDAGLDGPLDASLDAAPDADETPIDPFIVEVNPLGDGTSFAFVTSYRGRVVVGPSADGMRITALDPDGANTETVTFRFGRDTSGSNTAANSTSEYRSIGATGCAENTAACGPNNESVRGVLAGVVLDGTPWLVIGGGHAAKGLEYVYMSSDTDEETLDFRYVDIKHAENGEAYTSTALEVLADRLYIGALGRGGAGPFLVGLTTTPEAPGSNPTNQEAISMQLAASPIGAAGGTTDKVDTLGTFNDKLYVANARGWMRSNSATPGPYDLLGGLLGWTLITPTASAFGATIDVKSPKLGDLYPADRAVPQMAAFAGRFYVARNTTTGPQLWMCIPSLLSLTDCNAGDWELVAAAAGAPDHTQLGATPLPTITLVAATSSHLYVGFDSATGVEVFRTSSTAPPSAADFVRLGPPGLGMPTATQIMDGRRLAVPGDDHVWLTIGSPSTPVSLVKLP